MKVLIVDDEPHIRKMMRITLEDAGYDVDEATDGSAALDAFGDGSRYAVVILDQKMPGLDGLETLKRLKARLPTACIVMATAFASIELAVDAMRLGATDFLRKPMTPETLRSSVAAAIAASASPALPVASRRRAAGPIEIATVTMNGFQIHRAGVQGQDAAGHVFRVVRAGDGREASVTVSIDPDAVERLARLTRRRLEPGGAFWRLQAERMLSAYIWAEGRPPVDGRLTVGDVSREDLDVAARWDQD
jgi:CheY-like chemotaxis protein